MPDLDAWARLSFWEHADRLVSESDIVIDRPAGSSHPTVKSFVYPLDYGFLSGTRGGDGEGIDVWIGSSAREPGTSGTPGKDVSAIACTVDPFKRNAEVKLLWRCSPAEIALVERFYEPQPQAAVLIRRPT
ncbi:hypothetical protein GCM10017673_56080 [Streptosporangium violaceochromogenes]|nr:hypothetical protein GCM10017673_56080 [Streptosporangium violaceochromogenes]